MNKLDGGYAITTAHLTLKASIPGASKEEFAELAAAAKANCPVSKVLKADIMLDAQLV